MEKVWTVLPFLAILACPLMMVFCIFGMRKMGSAAPTTEPLASSQLPAERAAALEEQLHAIQAELATHQGAGAQASRSAIRGAENQLVDVARRTAHATRRSA